MNFDQTVIQAKRFGVFSCRENDSLERAAQQMVEEDVSSLVVVNEEGVLAGIITRTDLLRALISRMNWADRPVAEFMSTEVFTVSPQTHLLDVAELLLNKGIHRVVVVRIEESKKRPVSVVSAADLVYHMVKST